MIETIVFAMLWAKVKLYLKIWKFEIYKEPYLIRPIFKHWSIYPIIFMTMVYIYLQYTLFIGDYSLAGYANIFQTTYFSLFFIVALHYNILKKYFQGIGCIIIGTILNTIAIKSNSGKMPTFISNSWATGYAKPDMFIKASQYGDFHVMGDMYSKMIPLTNTWDFGYACYSIGDIFCFAFIFLVLYNSIKESNNIMVKK